MEAAGQGDVDRTRRTRACGGPAAGQARGRYVVGDTARAARLQLEAIPLCNALFCEVNPIPVKMGISYLGFGECHMRLPLTNLEPAHCEQLKTAMKDYGLNV